MGTMPTTTAPAPTYTAPVCGVCTESAGLFIDRCQTCGADICDDCSIDGTAICGRCTPCARCGVRPQVTDAAAYEQPGNHNPYPSALDDHCEGCLEAGYSDWLDAAAFEAAADAAARCVD